MNLDWLSLEYLIENKDWLFSGIGLMIFTILGYFFFVRPMNRKTSQQLEDISDNIKNQGDTTSSKTSIDDSTINGPIHTGQGDINYDIPQKTR